jgi:hypothetical protein
MGLRKSTRKLLSKVSHPREHALYLKFSKHTMIPREAYVANLLLAQRSREIPGAVVECGTWRGGMIGGIASQLGKSRDYFLYDSFEGLPEAKPIDGEKATKWQKNPDDPFYNDNCTASIADAREAMRLSGVSSTTIVKGWFSDTLKDANFPGGIALLRLDADWYESTMDILNPLFSQVNPGGLLVIDDYFAWDGCSRAIHDYLSKHKRTERIETFRGVSFMKKRADKDETKFD